MHGSMGKGLVIVATSRGVQAASVVCHQCLHWGKVKGSSDSGCAGNCVPPKCGARVLSKGKGSLVRYLKHCSDGEVLTLWGRCCLWFCHPSRLPGIVLLLSS